MNNSSSAAPTNSRIDAIDAVRGVALFGVLVVNVLTAFRISLFQQFLPNRWSSADSLDGVVERFVDFALEMKSFSLFSILFGLGLAMQFERFARGGRPFYLLTRRLIALLVFGVIHLALIWNGDVLTEYALAGLLVLPLLRLSQSSLAAVAVGMLALYAVNAVSPLIPSPDPDALAEHVANANNVYAQGSFAEILRFSIREIELLVPLHVSVFPRTVGLFVFGAWIWRCGVIQHAPDNAGVFGWVAAVGILVGVTLTPRAADPFLQRLAPVALAIGYGSLVVWIAQFEETRRLLAPFAAVGRMAFTNYILHSVIFGFIFFGYGLGRFGQMGAASALLLVALVYSFQALFSTLWLRRFRFGPLEWLWRSITYNRIQPMRIERPLVP
ncbi:MAG TPA: DUF418 domain-containing protein [Gammaproteobacteria bacterium]|nr:DUF418 domain-containing protein [Gammaproteobacteria bacterium]